MPIESPSRRLGVARLKAWSAVAALLAISLVVLLALRPSDTPAARGPARTLPSAALALHTLDGASVDPSVFKGRPFAFFFGFTNCPIVCPTTMMELTGWLQDLKGEAKDFRVYFVTLDPERDTPEKLKDYLEGFSPQIVGLTGAPQEIDAAAKAFSVYYQKVPTSSGYTLEHTALIFLYDAQGRQDGGLVYGLNREAAVAKLRALLEKR